ncbi:MAG TPA: 50S ribosomal protein L10 [Phycisphaerae bacterium]|nr:50S ribosomal protein L10 [Phycisphaerae bacterium]
MSKPLKNMLTAYLKDRYAGVESACVVDLTGLDVQTTEKLRKAIRAKGGRLEVVRNRLAREAFADSPLQPLGAALSGPSALVVTDDSIIDIAKALVDFTKESKKLTLKEAILDGDPALLTVKDLSTMKSRLEIIGDIAGLIWGPGRRVAGAIASPQGKIAGCLKAIADKEAA